MWRQNAVGFSRCLGMTVPGTTSFSEEIEEISNAFPAVLDCAAVGVFADRHLRLLEFLVVTTIDRASRHTGDQRRIFAALGIGAGRVLPQQCESERHDCAQQ